MLIILLVIGTSTIGAILIRLLAIGVLPQRQQPGAARSWLLIIFFLPILGLLLYWLIGENRLGKRRIEAHRRVMDRLQNRSPRFDNRPGISDIQLSADAQPLANMVERMGRLPVFGGNTVEIITDYSGYIDQLAEDIDQAKHHVHLLFYIYADDIEGRKITEALYRAVDRGVKCRVLTDSVGVRAYMKKMGTEMADRGIEVQETLPVGFMRARVARFDLRNHRKIAVIDGQIGHTGSQNIVETSYHFGDPDLKFEELMVRLTGPAALQLQAVFATDWYLETDEDLFGTEFFPDPQVVGNIAAQVLPSGPTYEQENYQRLTINMMYAARQRIVITTPYFIPDEPFVQAMEAAVLRGVEVILIVTRRDQLMVGLAQSAFYDELLKNGIKIYRYTKALLHAKHMSIDDDVALIGSSNMDYRSFSLNNEVSMIFYGEPVVQLLHAEQRRCLQDSDELTLEEWQKRPAKDRYLQNLARLAGPLL